MNTKGLLSAPTWVAGTAIALLVASGIVGISSSVPAMGDGTAEGAPHYEQGTAGSGAELSRTAAERAQLPAARAGINPPGRARCPECGVVDSVRPIEPSGDSAEGESADSTPTGEFPDRTSAGNAPTQARYEVTVRRRDGSTAVFYAGSPRTWQTGDRVIMIGGANASRD